MNVKRPKKRKPSKRISAALRAWQAESREEARGVRVQKLKGGG